ncbi:MAG: hypothetical protein FJZ89_02045 [Chloroflexi bacterium]|nr:hypothetical protein [Chloroflexota bacterium]
MPAKIASAFAARLRRNPQATVAAIVRVSIAPDEAAARLTERGATVRRVVRLVPAVAVQMPAADCLALANETWVSSVEEDKAVHTLQT